MAIRKPSKLPKVIDRKDINNLLAKINVKYPTGLRNRVALELMYRAGLRVNEVCNLSPVDVDLEHGFIYVQQGKGKKDRVVPLDPSLTEWCARWLAKRPPSEYFICTLAGGKVSDRYLREVCYRLSRKAGVTLNDNHRAKLIHPHTLRHCFGTELVEEGFTLPEVKELMGHASINTTMVYTHVRPEALAAKIRQRRGAE
jgi:site-specific recombinase XerD